MEVVLFEARVERKPGDLLVLLTFDELIDEYRVLFLDDCIVEDVLFSPIIPEELHSHDRLEKEVGKSEKLD